VALKNIKGTGSKPSLKETRALKKRYATTLATDFVKAPKTFLPGK